MTLAYLDVILRYMTQEEFTHRENIPIMLSDYLNQNPHSDLDKFTKFVESIRSDFFRINRIDRLNFAREIFHLCKTIKSTYIPEVEENESLTEKVNLLIRLAKEGQNERHDISSKLDEVIRIQITQIQSILNEIIDILDSFEGEFTDVKTIRRSQVMQSILDRIIIKRQEKQQSQLEQIQSGLSMILTEMRKDESKGRKILNGVRDLGVSIVSDALATVLLRMAGFS